MYKKIKVIIISLVVLVILLSFSSESFAATLTDSNTNDAILVYWVAEDVTLVPIFGNAHIRLIETFTGELDYICFDSHSVYCETYNWPYPYDLYIFISSSIDYYDTSYGSYYYRGSASIYDDTNILLTGADVWACRSSSQPVSFQCLGNATAESYANWICIDALYPNQSLSVSLRVVPIYD